MQYGKKENTLTFHNVYLSYIFKPFNKVIGQVEFLVHCWYIDWACVIVLLPCVLLLLACVFVFAACVDNSSSNREEKDSSIVRPSRDTRWRVTVSVLCHEVCQTTRVRPSPSVWGTPAGRDVYIYSTTSKYMLQIYMVSFRTKYDCFFCLQLPIFCTWIYFVFFWRFLYVLSPM